MAEEGFRRVVGKRQNLRPGEVPTREQREAMDAMAHYRTRAPKGVFRYKTHEEANRARDAWTVERMVDIARDKAE